MIFKCQLISVCYNNDNQVCNHYGSNKNCGEKNNCGPCMKEYQGNNCGSCKPGYFPANGTNGIVNSTTGEGVLCKGTAFHLPDENCCVWIEFAFFSGFTVYAKVTFVSF